MAPEETDVDAFLRSWFCKLPWLALEMIFSHVQLRYEYSSLLQVPKLRGFWVWHFSSRTIMICPKAEQQKSQFEWNPSNSDICFDNNENIAAFFLDYPDILPNRFVVAAPEEFASSFKTLEGFYYHLAKAPKLEIWLRSKAMSPEDLDILFQFRNLWKLFLYEIDFDPHRQALSRKFLLLASLRELEFSGCKFSPSGGISLPPNLLLLNLNIRDESSFDESSSDEMSPSSELISHVFPGNTNLFAAAFHQLAFPETLKNLSIKKYEKVTLDFSLLPPALEILSLAGECWEANEGPILPWPETLTSIKLSFLREFEPEYQQLLPREWPSGLRILHLRGTWLYSLDVLVTLPPTIEDLQIENASIETLCVFDDEEYCSYPELLPALKSLQFKECPNIYWELFDDEEEGLLSPRIDFPPGLSFLEILKCGLENISYLEFPVSLEVLDLSSNRISNLNTYESYEDEDELICWNALINLRDLFVQHNEIDTLEYWCPPRSLVQLYLLHNHLQTLTAWETPLFDIRYSKFTESLETLDICGNRLLQIELNLHIPSNLRVLELSENSLPAFQFVDSIASHENLRRLELRRNPITSISLPSPRNLYSSKLQAISFYLTHGIENGQRRGESYHISSEYENIFYGVLEQLGLKNINRNFPLAREHYFC